MTGATLDEEERCEYERLLKRYAGEAVMGESPRLQAIARGIVARRRADAADLRAEAERVFGLSWLDEFTLYGAWRVVRNKGVPVLNRMIGNWQTSLAAFVVAAVLYIQQNGMQLPHDAAGWKALLLAAAIQAFGLAAKDANTGSAPGAKGSARVLALPLVVLIGLFALGCGDSQHNGNIECIFGDGSSVTVDGAFQCATAGGTVTNQPDSGNTTTTDSNNPSTTDTTTTTNNPAPTPTAA